MSVSKTIKVNIVSAEKEIFSGDAEMLVANGQAGEVGIYPGHAALLTVLNPGTTRIKLPGQAEETVLYISGGILEVQPAMISILSDTVVRAEDIDQAEAQEAKELAEANLKYRKSEVDYATAARQLAEAAARLQAVKSIAKWRKKA